MTRVIVHAGFHKTGTSSLQTYLGQNRAALRPWLSFAGVGDRLHRSAVAARVYAKKPFSWRLRQFRRAMRADLAALEDAPVLVLSREHYAGVMPGLLAWNRRPITSFVPAGTALGRVIAGELRRRYGPQCRVEFLFTTREAESWARSVHAHLLRSSRLTDEFDAFRQLFPARIDLAEDARTICAAIGPDAAHIAALEDHATARAGPAEVVLDLAGVPGPVRRALPPARRVNTAVPPELAERFLELNRTVRSARALARRKAALLEET